MGGVVAGWGSLVRVEYSSGESYDQGSFPSTAGVILVGRWSRVYPLLAGIWSPLHLAASNAGEWVQLSDLQIPLAISVAVAAAFWIIAALLTRDPISDRSSPSSACWRSSGRVSVLGLCHEPTGAEGP